VSLAGVPVIGLLVAASVIAGLGTPVGLAFLIGLARDPLVMGPAVISRRLALAGWAVAVIVGGLGLLYIFGTAAGIF
jgi:Mn2+/Fe2+ NRAMP family transporter